MCREESDILSIAQALTIESTSERGFKLTFESPKNDKLSLFQHGARAYDHLILLPGKAKGINASLCWAAPTKTFAGLGPALTPKLLIEFINNKGNILLTLSADSATPTSVSSLLLELDIQLPPDRTSLVVDHFNFDTLSASEKHDVLLVPQPKALRPDVRNFFGGDGVIAFPRGVAQELGSASPLLAPILKAKATSYSYNPKEETESVEDPFTIGEQISLVSSMQARNSARFTVLGSIEAFENKWFDASVKSPEGQKIKTANREFAKQLTAWTFLETGVLEVGRVEHHLSSVTQGVSGNDSIAQLGYLNPKIYRIKNDVVGFNSCQFPMACTNREPDF